MDDEDQNVDQGPSGGDDETSVVEQTFDPNAGNDETSQNEAIPPEQSSGEADVPEEQAKDEPTGETETSEGPGVGPDRNQDVPGVGTVDLSLGQFGKILHEPLDNLMDHPFGVIARAHAADNTAQDPTPVAPPPAPSGDANITPASPSQGAQPDSQTNPQTQPPDQNNPNTWGKSAPFILREAMRQGTLDKLPPSVFQAAGMTYDAKNKQLAAAPGSGAPNATPGTLPPQPQPQPQPAPAPAQHGPMIPAQVNPQARNTVDAMRQNGYTVQDIANRYGWGIFDKAGYQVNQNPPKNRQTVTQSVRGPGNSNSDDVRAINDSLPTWSLSPKPPTQGSAVGPPGPALQPGSTPPPTGAAFQPGSTPPPTGGGSAPGAPANQPFDPNSVTVIKGGRVTQGPQTGLTPEQQQMMNNFRDRRGNVPPSVANQIMKLGHSNPTIDAKTADRAAHMIQNHFRANNSYDNIPKSWWDAAGMKPPPGTKVGGDGSPATGTQQPTNAKSSQASQALSGVPAAAITYLQQHPDQAPYFDRKYGPGSAAAALGQ